MGRGRGSASSDATAATRRGREPAPLRAADLPDVGPYGGSLDSAAHNWFAAGGCVHLALAFKAVYPEMKVACDWYDDRGHRGISHAVAYDPATGRGFDVYGTNAITDHLPLDPQYSLEVDMDADPEELARHMQFPWSEDNPWESNGVYEGAEFIRDHFGADLF